MKKSFFQKAAAVCCIIAIIIIRVISLWKLPVLEDFYELSRRIILQNYIVQLVFFSAIMIVSASIYKIYAHRTVCYRNHMVLAVMAIFLFFYFVMQYFQASRGIWNVRALLSALCPVWMFLLADGIKRHLNGNGLRDFLLGLACYYLVVTGLAWVLEVKAMELFGYCNEPVETVYLFTVSAVAWILAKGRKERKRLRKQVGQKKRDKAIRLGMTLLLPLFLLPLFFLRNDRVYEIAGSLQLPFSVTEAGGGHPVNWLGYRWAVFWESLCGNFSFQGYSVVALRNCPLKCVHYTMGWFWVLLVAGLQACLFYCLMSVSRRQKYPGRASQFVLTVLVSMLIQEVFGLLADVFLISSTGIGLLLMKRPGDIMLVLGLVFFADAMQENRRRGLYIVKR